MKSSMGVVLQTLLWYFWNTTILGIIWWMWKLCSDDGPRESETWKSWINIYQFKTSIHPLQDKLNVEKRNVFTKFVNCKVYIGMSQHEYKQDTNTSIPEIHIDQMYEIQYGSVHSCTLFLCCFDGEIRIYDPHTEKNMNNKDNQVGLQTKYGCTSNPLVTAASLPLSSSSTWNLIFSMYERLCVCVLDLRLE